MTTPKSDALKIEKYVWTVKNIYVIICYISLFFFIPI
jgi:hypothetical protein